MKVIMFGLLADSVLAGCATAPAIDPSARPAIPLAFKEGDGRWTVAALGASATRQGGGWT